MKSWVLVADSSRGRIFSAETPTSALKEIESISHPEGRLHDQLMVSDLPGKNAGAAGAGGHAYQDETEPREQEMTVFAKWIARHLDEAYQANKFKKLLIISAPAFLGEIRNQLSDAVRKSICFELDKNLTLHSADDIRNHLPEHLPVH